MYSIWAISIPPNHSQLKMVAKITRIMPLLMDLIRTNLCSHFRGEQYTLTRHLSNNEITTYSFKMYLIITIVISFRDIINGMSKMFSAVGSISQNVLVIFNSPEH